MTVESALLNNFESECKSVLGKMLNKLGFKARCLLRNVVDIKRLIWTLLNADCVTFYQHLSDLRTFDSMNSAEQDLYSFSIFKMCDNDTNRLIITLSKLAKDRIYKIIPRLHTI